MRYLSGKWHLSFLITDEVFPDFSAAAPHLCDVDCDIY